MLSQLLKEGFNLGKIFKVSCIRHRVIFENFMFAVH